jgi:hypothetical protein
MELPVIEPAPVIGPVPLSIGCVGVVAALDDENSEEAGAVPTPGGIVVRLANGVLPPAAAPVVAGVVESSGAGAVVVGPLKWTGFCPVSISGVST